jgi:hypothetical protein
MGFGVVLCAVPCFVTYLVGDKRVWRRLRGVGMVYRTPSVRTPTSCNTGNSYEKWVLSCQFNFIN